MGITAFSDVPGSSLHRAVGVCNKGNRDGWIEWQTYAGGNGF